MISTTHDLWYKNNRNFHAHIRLLQKKFIFTFEIVNPIYISVRNEFQTRWKSATINLSIRRFRNNDFTRCFFSFPKGGRPVPLWRLDSAIYRNGKFCCSRLGPMSHLVPISRAWSPCFSVGCATFCTHVYTGISRSMTKEINLVLLW